MIYNIEDKEAAIDVAARLLDVEAIKLNLEKPFIWSSGWHSPIYCDNRIALSFPNHRRAIRDLLVKRIREYFPRVESIAGVATAGIPQGALVAEEMDLPFCYVRSSPKGHGMKNLIEGKINSGTKAVVIEDLISTGGSSLKAIEALRINDVEVLGLGAIFSYDFDIATENFSNENVDAFVLSNYNYLIEVALNRGYIQDNKLEKLNEWRRNPGQWMP